MDTQNEKLEEEKAEKVERMIKTEDGREFYIEVKELISRSKYFRALFHYNRHKCVSIPGVSGDNMELILNYIEKGCDLSKGSDIFSFLMTADYLMLDEILREIISKIPKIITLYNCISFLNVSLNLPHLGILQLCSCFIRTHFESAVQCADIGNLSFDHLKLFLSDSNLNVDDEGIVWRAIVKWVESDPQERISRVPSLVKCIRLELCSEQLLQELASHPFVCNDEAYGSIFTQNMQKNAEEMNLKQRFVEVVRSSSPEPINLGPRQKNIICSVSVKNYDWRYITEVFIISADTNMTKTIKIAEMKDFFPWCTFNINEKIYIFYFKDGLFLDLYTCSWKTVPPLVEEENVDTFVIISGSIYAIWDDFELKKCRIAVFVPEQWKELQSLPYPENYDFSYLQATVHEGVIYLTSANDDTGNPTKVLGHIYDPVTDMWSNFDLPEEIYRNPRMEVVTISFKGMLLLMQEKESSVKFFYLEEGIWRTFKVLTTALRSPGMKIRDGTLFVGGFVILCDGSGGEQYKTERLKYYWDEDSRDWIDCSSSQIDWRADNHVIEDPALVRKFHRQLMEDEWNIYLEQSD